MYWVAVYLHILAAAVWVGGNLLFFAVAPTLRREAPQAFRLLGRRFRVLSWVAVLVLLVTGVYLLALGWESRRDLLLWKMVLFGVAVVVKAAHDFWIAPRAGSARGVYVPLAMWVGRTNLVVQLVIVYLSVGLSR
jgi:putative copper export protein